MPKPDTTNVPKPSDVVQFESALGFGLTPKSSRSSTAAHYNLIAFQTRTLLLLLFTSYKKAPCIFRNVLIESNDSSNELLEPGLSFHY